LSHCIPHENFGAGVWVIALDGLWMTFVFKPLSITVKTAVETEFWKKGWV